MPQRLTDSGENQEATWSASGERIAFESNRSGTWQIWTMASDGSEQVALTSIEGGARAPSFSPDGSRIVFVSPVDSVPQVMEVTVTNGSLRQLTTSPGAKSQPSLSPDGALLAFVSEASGAPEIHVAHSDGAEERRVTRFADAGPRHFVNGLGWTPQNELIFATNLDGRGRFFFVTDVFTLRSDGTALRRILSGDGNHNNPSMARNGSRIAFDAFRFGGADVFVADADGSSVRNLTRTSRTNFFPTPLPDGSGVVFQSQRDGNREIYRADRDGGNVRNLTSHPTDDRAPSLSRDGSLIVFASFRHSDWGAIYTMNETGGDVTRVTPAGFFEALNQFPVSTAVTPDGETILFESVPIAAQGDAHWDIWRIGSDGSAPERLTDSPGSTRSAAPAVSPDGRSFLYYADATGDFEIYRMAIDGGDAERLTRSEGSDYYPSWSPDGRWIYFSSTRGGHADIYRMSASGSDVERITHGTREAALFYARVDQAGRNLWVLSSRDGGTELQRLEADGTGEISLTAPWGPTPDDAPLSETCRGFTRLGQPHWSWARNQIAFPGDCGGEQAIWVYDVATDDLSALDIGLEGLDSPAWSNAGDRIAFNAEDSTGARDMYVYDVGSGRTSPVTTGGVHGGWVTWSPDDRFLNGYSRNDAGRWHIVRIAVDGGDVAPLNASAQVDEFTVAESPAGGVFIYSSAQRVWLKTGEDAPRPITPTRMSSVMPHWAPDGDRFVFDGNDGFGWNLFLGRVDGREPVQLTRTPNIDSNATWSPEGGRLVYLCRLGDSVTSICMLDVETRRARPLFRPGGP